MPQRVCAEMETRFLFPRSSGKCDSPGRKESRRPAPRLRSTFAPACASSLLMTAGGTYSKGDFIMCEQQPIAFQRFAVGILLRHCSQCGAMLLRSGGSADTVGGLISPAAPLMNITMPLLPVAPNALQSSPREIRRYMRQAHFMHRVANRVYQLLR